MTPGLRKERIANIAAIALLVSVLTANLWWAEPYFNWDVVGYVGAVISSDGGDAQEIHDATWDEIRERVSPEVLALLDGTARESKLRKAVANDPESLHQQLPLALVKPLYPALMSMIASFGVNLLDASVLISATAYCLIGLLCFVWMRQHYSSLYSVLIASVLVSMPFVLDLSMLSTPDALSVLFLLFGFYLAAKPSGQLFALGIFIFAILVRPDNVLLALAVSAVGFFFWDGMRKTCAVAAVAAVLTYAAVMTYSGMYGWGQTFYAAFVDSQPYPATADVRLQISQYLYALAGHSYPRMLGRSSYNFVLMAFLSLITLRLIWARERRWNRSMQLLFAAQAYAVAHWLILPSQKDRLLASFYLLVIIVLVIEVQNYVKQSKTDG